MFEFDTTVFPVDIFWIMYMHLGGAFQNRIAQGGEVYNL